jgi:hypothetical protein
MPIPPVIWTIQAIHIQLAIIPFFFFLTLPFTLRILRTFIDVRFSITPSPIAFIDCCSPHHPEITNAYGLRWIKFPRDYEFVANLCRKLALRGLGQDPSIALMFLRSLVLVAQNVFSPLAQGRTENPGL